MVEERAVQHFFGMSLQYYVAGRFSAFAWHMPVAGNLLHHAIEMMLKGQLSRKLSLADLKRLGHGLPDLWERFKEDVAATGLDDFDRVVTILDKFEAIRYPDRILAEGMFGTISILSPDSPTLEIQSEPTPPAYHLVVEDVDRLVKAIFEKSHVNPRFFRMLLLRDGGAFLTKDNKWALDF